LKLERYIERRINEKEVVCRLVQEEEEEEGKEDEEDEDERKGKKKKRKGDFKKDEKMKIKKEDDEMLFDMVSGGEKLKRKREAYVSPKIEDEKNNNFFKRKKYLDVSNDNINTSSDNNNGEISNCSNISNYELTAFYFHLKSLQEKGSGGGISGQVFPHSKSSIPNNPYQNFLILSTDELVEMIKHK
jgi:hypothetical protein